MSSELSQIATDQLGIGGRAAGAEIYYNYAATPYLRITPDLQVFEPAITTANTALVLGLRVQLDF